MSENGNSPVSPTTDSNYDPKYASTGLTKRELFAAMVLQGMWAGRLAAEGDFPAYAMNAVFQADDLLAALEAK